MTLWFWVWARCFEFLHQTLTSCEGRMIRLLLWKNILIISLHMWCFQQIDCDLVFSMSKPHCPCHQTYWAFGYSHVWWSTYPLKARQWQVVSFQWMPPCLACIKWITSFSLFLTMTGNGPSSSKDLPVTCEIKTFLPVTFSLRLPLITSWSKLSSILNDEHISHFGHLLCLSWVSWLKIMAWFYFSDGQLAMMKEVILSNLKSHNFLLLTSVLETIVQANSLRL